MAAVQRPITPRGACRRRWELFFILVESVYRLLMMRVGSCAVVQGVDVGRHTDRVSIPARRVVTGSEHRSMDLGLYMSHCGHRDKRWTARRDGIVSPLGL